MKSPKFRDRKEFLHPDDLTMLASPIGMASPATDILRQSHSMKNIVDAAQEMGLLKKEEETKLNKRHFSEDMYTDSARSNNSKPRRSRTDRKKLRRNSRIENYSPIGPFPSMMQQQLPLDAIHTFDDFANYHVASQALNRMTPSPIPLHQVPIDARSFLS